MGTALIAASGNFGFIAPVLAAESPATIDAINVYLPIVALNGVAFGGFVVGFVIFGMAMAKTTGFPRFAGLLVAAGAPGPSVRLRSGPDRRIGVVDRCHPWQRGPWRWPCLAWVSTVAEPGVLTRSRPGRQMPIASTQLGRPNELCRRETFDQRQAHHEVFLLASAFGELARAAMARWLAG
jgi:hypothetical protein